MEQNKIQKELLVHLIQQQNQFKSLKAEVDKIDIDNLKTVPADLSKTRNVVNNDVVKETIFDKLVAKINAINTSGFGSKKNNDDADKKILETSGLFKKTLK